MYLFGPTIHLQNYGPTSETLKHGHMRCNDFWIESCFSVHSSKIISKKLRISTSQTPKHGHIQSYSMQRFLADCRCIRFVTNQYMQLQQLNTDLILILNFAIVYLHFVF